MAYVDCFVAAVPTANRETYRQHSEQMAGIFKENGAIKQVECWGDDVPKGEVTSFPMAVQSKEDETVVVGWLIWPSKEVRDGAWEKIMQDPRMHNGSNPMPFDGKRLIHGGFDMIFET